MIPNWVIEFIGYLLEKKYKGKLLVNLSEGGITSIDQLQEAHEHWTRKRWEVERSGLS